MKSRIRSIMGRTVSSVDKPLRSLGRIGGITGIKLGNTLRVALALVGLVAVFPLHAALPDTIAPVKNIIVMIPDGTSLSALSLARWYQRYNAPDQHHLTIDDLLRGTVITYSSDAPIGDSAPTTSCYMSGVVSQTGFISTYPEVTDHDIVPTDSTRSLRPAVTLAEAGKWKLHKRIGLVVTCEYPHATPADCVAHSYDRRRYDMLSPQMASLPVDVMLGGGTSILKKEERDLLASAQIPLIEDNLAAMRAYKGSSLWCLFGKKAMPFDLDRDTTAVPSLAEMTAKALECLSTNNNDGFFLMVEGSKVDWAAHANDPVGIATEMLAFDRAVRVALDFAKRNGETAVVVVPDHGNSGLSVGDATLPHYDKASAEELFGLLTSVRRTASGMAEQLNAADRDRAEEFFRTYAGITLTKEDLHRIYTARDYKHSPLDRDSLAATSMYGSALSDAIAAIYRSRMPFGFTTKGHTAEDVFLGVYHPNGTVPHGVLLNTELNRYLCALWGLEGVLPRLTEEAYVPFAELFPGKTLRVLGEQKHPEYLSFDWRRGVEVRIYPYTRRMEVGSKRAFARGKQKTVQTPNNSVWMDKNGTLYLNRNIEQLIANVL